jgi:hypothetical protein
MTTMAVGAAPGRRAATSWRWVAAAGVLGAGALHVAAAVEHRSAGDLVAGFFVVSAAAQLGLGAWLAFGTVHGRSPGNGVLAAALSGTVLLVCLYLVVHTTDLLAGVTGHEAGGAAGHATGHGAGAAVEVAGPVALGARAPAEAEPPDLLGTGTVAVELLSVLGLAALLPRSWRVRMLDGVLVLGAVAWTAWLTGLLG